MTRTEIERIAVLETKVDGISTTLDKVDSKLDAIVIDMHERVNILEAFHNADDIRHQQASSFANHSQKIIITTVAVSNFILAIVIFMVNHASVRI